MGSLVERGGRGGIDDVKGSGVMIVVVDFDVDEGIKHARSV